MAEIFQSSEWNGVAVDTYTDTTTGAIKVYQKGFAPLGGLGGVLIAESVPANGKSDWTLTNRDRYMRAINTERDKKGQSILSQPEFDEQFFSNGARKFNNDRAAVLNKDGTLSTEERQGFFDNRVPFTSNPDGNKERVNFDQTITTVKVVDELAQPDKNGNGNGDGSTDVKLEEVIPPPSAATDESDKINVGTDPDGSGGSGGAGGAGGADGSGGAGGADGDGSTSTTTTSDTNEEAFLDSNKVDGKNELLKYPSIAPPPGMQFDYIQITAYEYTPSGLNPSKNRAVSALKGKEYETVQLPMQPTITESNAVSWTNDTINDIQRGLAKVSEGAIKFMGDGSKEAIEKALAGGANDVTNLLRSDTAKNALIAFFAGQAVGARLMGRSTGAIINPNLELLFSGPGLRTFNFTFKLTPRNKEESEVIRKIIRAFKRNSAVQTVTAAFFLKSPRIFKLEYIYKDGGQHPYLNKFKPCALTNFSVNYTPDGSYMVFNDTGSLTAYDIQLSFTEIVPVYADDYNGPDTDMGF